MTEQHPETPEQRPSAPDPADIHAVLRGLRGMYDEAPGEPTERIRERRPVDPAAALRAAGITPPDEHEPVGDDADEKGIPLHYAESRLRVPMNDRTRRYVDVILGDGAPDALQVAANHTYSRHPRTDVVIPPKKAEAVPSEATTEGGRHAKKRSLRHRFALGTAAIVASAASLFSLTSSEAPTDTPRPAPSYTQEQPSIPENFESHPSSTVVTDEVTGDTVTTVENQDATTITIEMGAQNTGGPWAMTVEALKASGIDAPTNSQIATANPWMKTAESQAEARTLQPGATIQYRFQDGRLTSAYSAS